MIVVLLPRHPLLRRESTCTTLEDRLEGGSWKRGYELIGLGGSRVYGQLLNRVNGTFKGFVFGIGVL